MNIKNKCLILTCFVIFGVTTQAQNADSTIAMRFSLPKGYVRKVYAENSFQRFLQNFPLKPADSKVLYYNGQEKSRKIHVAVLDIDVGDRDLQQCADAVMRLRAEYLFKQKKYSEIHFNLTNGFTVNYLRWADGERVNVSGNKTWWVKSAQKDYSYRNFKKYLFFVFYYAGTLSLSKELQTIKYADLQVGDVFIRGGSPGHAMIVVDVAENAQGKKIFLLAQSYMPAQNIHIVKNLHNPAISPYYELDATDNLLLTPEWTFRTTELKRFKN
ncbi:MAG: DUF4846 domain-containing protein [Dysgonamonadaceae bacterium]|jgi:hypothetical protein|nr:DUF4846 domain-containing protein [Dysgonamonadaceae bacterium]